MVTINETRREVSRTIVKAIGDWIARPEGKKGGITVYIDTDGITDTYTTGFPPSDHAADLINISEWTFGDRHESIEDYENEPLSDEEASALIEMFCDTWQINQTTDGREIDYNG